MERFLATPVDNCSGSWLGALANDLELEQKGAWQEEIKILAGALQRLVVNNCVRMGTARAGRALYFEKRDPPRDEPDATTSDRGEPPVGHSVGVALISWLAGA